MSVLVISVSPDGSISSMGNVVDNCESLAFARYIATDDEAIDYVARVNADNDYEAPKFNHFFIYPSKDCPIGGITLEGVVCLDLRDADSIIPEYLRETLERKEAAYRKIRKEKEAQQRILDTERRREEQRQRDLMELEHLKKKLGVE